MGVCLYWWKRKSGKKIQRSIRKLWRLPISTAPAGEVYIEGEDIFHNLEKLTGMEYAVAQLAGLEWSNQEIADYLEISLRTVKCHMTSIFSKLHIGSRKGLVGKYPH